MRLEKRIKKHGTNNPKGSLADRANRMMHELRADDDPVSSRSSRIKGYSTVAALTAASLIGGAIYKAGGLGRVLEYVGGLSAKVKTGIGIAALATATGTGIYIVNQPDSPPIQPVQPSIEQKLPIGSYTLTETDIKRNDILYGLLEEKFGYTMRDEKGNYVPLRTTEHHRGNPETFLEAFMRLNPELYRELQIREQRARRPGDQSFQYLRPRDEIKFYTAK